MSTSSDQQKCMLEGTRCIMSKVVSSLLCDFVIPVVGGSIFEALATVATLCGEMKENEAVCRRVYHRLQFIYEELQKCSDASSLHENQTFTKKLLRRLIESSRVAERIQQFHQEIDELFKLLSIVHMAEMSAWRQEWEQDRTMQQNMLHEALAES
ncbi:Serine/threonine protein kinase [Phytophthora megakarya]|uniref:Serine/threonine protein kinase n=1 Tax=Phytophthora megakarya TaxID=4795 RepID=A0A225WHZ0_9STRA|nr:Serine/threonine protein kinase [Phytophthora megakarya]